MLKLPHQLLSKCENLFLEAKRVLLNEQSDKIADETLSDDHTPKRSDKMLSGYPEIANESKPEILTGIDDLTKVEKQPENDPNSPQLKRVLSRTILVGRCFNKWRSLVKAKTSTSEKLDEFMTNLKSHQDEPRPKSANNKSLLEICDNSKYPDSIKNRFKCQKTIIDMQRSKIEEQAKIISELKMGIIRDDLIKSMDNTKINIREIFSDCSGKLSLGAPMLQPADERERMMINSQKVPKTYQKMQERAIERAKYREIILERKRLIEATRQRLLEEAIDKKKTLEEEERKHYLEMMIEERKRKLHLLKIHREKAQENERKLQLAINFHKQLLMRQSFRKLFINYLKSKENYTLAIEHYQRKQKYESFKTWYGLIEAKYKIKEDMADAHYELKLKKRAFGKFKENRLDCELSMQVAADYHDMWLTMHAFNRWHTYTCVQMIWERQKMEIAEKHYKRRLLFQYFFQWRTLKAVLELEKTKEEKKRKWREKVWEFLPDYEPPEEE